MSNMWEVARTSTCAEYGMPLKTSGNRADGLSIHKHMTHLLAVQRSVHYYTQYVCVDGWWGGVYVYVL